MAATRDNPAQDRIILGRFFRYPRIGPGYTFKVRGKQARRSSLGCLIRWLMDCTISLDHPHALYHSYDDFSEELGFASGGSAVRKISHLNDVSTDGEIFVQLSFWIEEIFGYKNDDGKIIGPRIDIDELVHMSNLDDRKGIKWMALASRIQEHVISALRDRGLKV